MKAEGGEAGEGLLSALEEMRPALRRLFKKHEVELADAEDILQEAVVVMLRQWERIVEPRGYLLGTARRLTLLFLRRRQREGWVPLEETWLGALGVVSSEAGRIESREDVRRLLGRLPRRAGRILEMKYGQGLSSKEMAVALEVAESGVRKICDRQLQRLRRVARTPGMGG